MINALGLEPAKPYAKPLGVDPMPVGLQEPAKTVGHSKKGGAKHAEHASAEEPGAECSHAAETVGRPRHGRAQHVEYAGAEDPGAEVSDSVSLAELCSQLHSASSVRSDSVEQQALSRALVESCVPLSFECIARSTTGVGDGNTAGSVDGWSVVEGPSVPHGLDDRV